MLLKHSKLFQDPQIDYPIYDLKLAFSDYIAKSKDIIVRTRQDLNNTHSELIIDTNTPFELRPSKPPTSGILLLHGLLDSPFIMRDLANYFQAQGMLVRAMMLPGHSTVPGGLLNVNCDQWQQTVSYGIASLKTEVEKVFVLGYSTGGSLGLKSVVADPSLAGLILLAPAVKINSPFTFLAPGLSAIGKKCARAQWCCLETEDDYAKYQSFPFNAVNQVYQLGLDIKKGNVAHCPVFLALSYEDEVVCSRASLKYFQTSTHPMSRALVYSAKNNLEFTDSRISVRSSVYPDMGIVNFSHIALPVSPGNAHYGKDGNYAFASHPQPNIKLGTFPKRNSTLRKLALKMHLTQHRYQRLTFNPDFAFMQNAMGEFVEAVLSAKKIC